MKALVFHRPGRVEINDVDDPKIEEPRDIILRVTSTAICGSDLHVADQLLAGIKGAVPRYSDFWGLGCDCFAF